MHEPASAPPACHQISFFKDDDQLCAEVAAFIAEGLVHDEPGLIVTTESHRLRIVRDLRSHGIDAEESVRAGNLLLADADDMLALLMPAGRINDGLYHEKVGTAVRELLRGRPGPLRIFGDMVDLLWQRGDYDAAIRIEMLSNQLAALHPISVICGYSMGHFLKTGVTLDVVTRLHGAVRQPIVQ